MFETSTFTLIISVLALAVSLWNIFSTRKIKSLDLRIKARASSHKMKRSFADLCDIIRDAKVSKQRYFSASGQLKSGVQVHWEKQLTTREQEIENLRPSIGRLTFVESSDISILEAIIGEQEEKIVTIDSIRIFFTQSLMDDKAHSQFLRDHAAAKTLIPAEIPTSPIFRN